MAKKTWQELDDNIEMLKDSAPFTKHDSQKPDLSIVPAHAVAAVARVMMYGEGKYGRNNWRKMQEGDLRRLLAAALRHLFKWQDAYESDNHLEEYDSETGYSHLWHAACCIAFMIHHCAETGEESPWGEE